MYSDQLTLPRKCEEGEEEEEVVEEVLKDTAIRRHGGGFLPRAADWREERPKAMLNVAWC